MRLNLPNHKPVFHMWGGKLCQPSPADFSISQQLGISKTLRLFLYQSGTEERPIPALFGIYPRQVQNMKARKFFSKAKSVCKFMIDLMKQDEQGRILQATFSNEPSVRSLNALVDEAQKRILNLAPAPKKRNGHSRLEARKIATVMNWVSKIRKKTGIPLAKKPKSSQSSSSQ